MTEQNDSTDASTAVDGNGSAAATTDAVSQTKELGEAAATIDAHAPSTATARNGSAASVVKHGGEIYVHESWLHRLLNDAERDWAWFESFVKSHASL